MQYMMRKGRSKTGSGGKTLKATFISRWATGSPHGDLLRGYTEHTSGFGRGVRTLLLG